ncbi:hypothetical protein [Kitasatospora sp. NPDC058190]|uniref:hypothetical protein n=1 Tax=Kitasatospora sp. NPDC058190 TaxID=3346371 RepID=UPI0036D909DD
MGADAVGVLTVGVLVAGGVVVEAAAPFPADAEGDAAGEDTDTDGELPAPVAVAVAVMAPAVPAAVPLFSGPHALSAAAITPMATADASPCLRRMDCMRGDGLSWSRPAARSSAAVVPAASVALPVDASCADTRGDRSRRRR